MFNKITEPEKIKDTLDAYMRYPDKQRAPFLATIFDRKQNLIYEGARPIGFCTNHETHETTVSLSNGDSNYCSLIGTVELSNIAYIEVLR